MRAELRLRAAPFGAWVRLGDDTLVAVDRDRARRLGLDDAGAWRDDPPPPEAPLEAHIAVTSRCPAACTGCYQSASPEGRHVDREALEATLRGLRDTGVFTVAFGGGEPMLRDDLGSLATLARALGMTPVVTTSGLGLTPRRAAALRDFAQVNVSHDGSPADYLAVRGFEGARQADEAIAMLVSAGITVGVNMVLTRQNVASVAPFSHRLADLGVRELQLLRYKPAGRAASPEYLARRLTPSQAEALGAALKPLAAALEGRLSLRIDCALVPLVAGALGSAAGLERFGVFGCEAGRYLAAVDREGALKGCSFVTESDSRMSIDAFRAFADAPPEPCAGCEFQRVCRGGCKVVATHLRGAMGPDPECPRVMAWERRA
ncbi:MAG: radical SAM protein [Myxococcales bacterium]|nr:radical SAM protein [Myxococcales bacterium]